ncbi:ABC transporter ATP-binding protein [Clostridium fallax]|uniref:ABC-type quaternary amine transporter n=1 Tax=Clostridium fallax TaxID=1533 RepID=A0A1M4Y572_9CLOT|nr:ABC transporter ATP-binding protein [Clostridium fallax]SHF00723.1 osmoprotectant transport system ATP-binding protein [Clostridium fallax]SQB07483.1 glycine betaine/carnitine/choline transport ATP-binding protein [Clostridium fallax]
MNERIPIISFKNVKKSYGDNEILSDFNLDIYKGEFITVIGTSGSGKTTVLKLINGLLKPDNGEVRINGENISSRDIIDMRRNIGYVIQGIGLFPHMNIEKNISYVLNLKKDKCKDNLKRVLELMDIVELDKELIYRYPSELSGGQKQRVGIARALASNPEILLMDEPFGAVDEITRRVLQDEILKIQKKLNMTIFFVTHDIKEAFKLGSKIVIMNKGKIVQLGDCNYIKNNPKNKFVSDLIDEIM